MNKNWLQALNRLTIMFEDQLTEHMQPWQLHRIVYRVYIWFQSLLSELPIYHLLRRLRYQFYL
ncbi:hypothetical protein VCHA38O210_40107 [Vibrio chagasii]|nr:hypothetical protein VCHA38O210_40107 [Vibrio chagasii]